MITNNYDNSLPRNTESELTFFADKAPVLFVRQFQMVFDYHDPTDAEHLIVPYYVDGCDESLSHDNRIGDTFTTIIKLDEDTVPQNEVTEFVRTTYAGEQVIDLGSVDELFRKGGVSPYGYHSFSIKTIQSTGIGSAVQYFRIFLKDSSTEHELNLDGFNGKVPFVEGTSGNTRALWRMTWAGYPEIDTTARYDINVNDGIISITETSQKQNEDESSKTYNIVTQVEDGETHILAEYTTRSFFDTPPCVRIAAVDNKYALNALMRAAVYLGYDRVKLPAGMEVVLDYHFHSPENNNTDTINNAVSLFDLQDFDNEDLSFKSNGFNGNDTKHPREDIRIPDDFTLDLNGSTISCLHCAGVMTDENGSVTNIYNKLNSNGGQLFLFWGNFNSHLINGKLKGQYLEYPFIKNKTTGDRLPMTRICGAKFCSFENLDVSGEIAYGMNATGASTYYKDGYKYPKFANGYIGMDGTLHDDKDNGLSDGIARMMVTESFQDISSIISVQQGWNAVAVCKNMNSNTLNGSAHRALNRYFFIHYYDDSGNFIKTDKIFSKHPVLVPLGATKAKLSAMATARYQTVDSVNHSDAEHGLFGIMSRSNSWNLMIKDCNFHDTRTCFVCVSGLQSVMEGCLFWNIAAQSGVGQVTKYAIDVEDNAFDTYNVYINDCEWLYGDTAFVNVYRGFNYNITNNRNFSVTFQDVEGGLISGNQGVFTLVNTWRFPEHYIKIENNYLRRMASKYHENQATNSRGSSDGHMYVQYCTVDRVEKGTYVTGDFYMQNSFVMHENKGIGDRIVTVNQ